MYKYSKFEYSNIIDKDTYFKYQIICKLILTQKKKSNPLFIGMTKSKQAVNTTYSNINYHIICK